MFIGLDWSHAERLQQADRRRTASPIARWQDGKGGWVQATDQFPFCYADAKSYSAPALEQGN